MAIEFLDEFNDTDGEALTTQHTPDIGAAWLLHPVSGSDYAFLSNRVYDDDLDTISGDTRAVITPADFSAPDYNVRTTLQHIAGSNLNDGGPIGILGRIENVAAVTAYVLQWIPGGGAENLGELRLSRFNGFVETILVSREQAADRFVDGEAKPVDFRIEGTNPIVTLIVDWDGVEVMNYEDSDANRITAPNRGAMISNGHTTTGSFHFERFEVDVDTVPGIVGDVPFAWGVAGTMQLRQSLVGNIPFDWAVASDMTYAQVISGNVPWPWAVNADIPITIIGDVPWPWNVDGDQVYAQTITGAVPFDWNVAGDMIYAQVISGDVAWPWAVAADLQLRQSLVGNVPWDWDTTSMSFGILQRLIGDVPFAWQPASDMQLRQSIIGDVPWPWGINAAIPIRIVGNVPWPWMPQALFAQGNDNVLTFINVIPGSIITVTDPATMLVLASGTAVATTLPLAVPNSPGLATVITVTDPTGTYRDLVFPFTLLGADVTIAIQQVTSIAVLGAQIAVIQPPAVAVLATESGAIIT